MKKRENILAILVVASLLLAQLFPMHLHIHNHFHSETSQYVSSELEFVHFDQKSSHHKHAIVSDVSSKISSSHNDFDNVIVLFVFTLMLFSLIFFKGHLRYTRLIRRLNLFYIRPILRAPPVQA